MHTMSLCYCNMYKYIPIVYILTYYKYTITVLPNNCNKQINN